MKEIIKKIALISLTCFSFFYTDKVINILNNKTPLMKEILSVEENYKIEPVNAIIEDNTIIPGVNGREIDVDKSYENMKQSGIFREELLIYNSLYPIEMLSNNKDKYIIKGNNSKKEVSLLIILDSKNINKITNNNITIFLNHKDINIDNIMDLKENEIYTYGNNGVYNEDILLNDNTIINRISNNKSNYCLVKNKDNDVQQICNKSNMYIVLPNIIGYYSDIKNNLSNGSIILIENINELNEIIKLINSKGYEIVGLSKLLEE